MGKVENAKKEALCKQVLPAFLKYKDSNLYDICLDGNLIRVEYQNNFYYIDIIEEENTLYWYLKPYKDSFFTTAITPNSFERVLFAITEASYNQPI